MKRAIYCGFALVALALPLSALAQELTFTTGEKLSHYLSVCIDKQDAVDIVEADRSEGREAAEAVWQAKERCANVNVVGPSVGKVAYSVKAKDGKVAAVVEIVRDGQVVGYFVTKSPVNKAQRNS